MYSQRKPLKKQQDGSVLMTNHNLTICLSNQQGSYETKQLNQSLHLQYYGFQNIQNLQEFSRINTLYLNNNTIEEIDNLQHLQNLVFLNLANNSIAKIQNLEKLKCLKVLDLSFNKIKKVQNLKQCAQLQTLSLSHNLLTNIFSLEGLQDLHKVISLNLSENQIQADLNIYNLLKTMDKLAVLYLKGTLFARGITSYRKQTLSNLSKLQYLDDRPVTSDERLLVNAWKQGGINGEKEARKQIIISKQKLNQQVYKQIKQRIDYAQKLRLQLFNELTADDQAQLQILNEEKLQKQQLSHQQYDDACIEAEQIEIYLDLMREQVKFMSVGDKPQITSIIQNQTEDAIYVYNIQQQDQQIVKNKFFASEAKPIIFKNIQKIKQDRWIPQYDNLLKQALQKSGISNKKKLCALFNIKVHNFDQKTRRKTRRFKHQEISEKLQQLNMGNSGNQIQNQMNQLD